MARPGLPPASVSLPSPTGSPSFPQVATGQPHEGSSYSARKDCQMALNRVDYARVKLAELSRTCEQALEQPSER